MSKAIPFYKYQGAGNDFVIVDNRDAMLIDRRDADLIRKMCDRRFGIGADGLMLLQNTQGFDFEMVYFNSDGRESTMCGNGGRCMAAFAWKLGLIQQHCRFLAVDGPHEAVIVRPGWVELRLSDVKGIESGTDFYCLNTGSPHYVRFVEDLAQVDVFQEGKAVRYSGKFAEEGINVNFVAEGPSSIEVATYERGVEAETLSCGTGVTASALSFAMRKGIEGYVHVSVHTKGGDLEVKFHSTGIAYTDVWLCGPALEVFSGIFPVEAC